MAGQNVPGTPPQNLVRFTKLPHADHLTCPARGRDGGLRARHLLMRSDRSLTTAARTRHSAGHVVCDKTCPARLRSTWREGRNCRTLTTLRAGHAGEVAVSVPGTCWWDQMVRW